MPTGGLEALHIYLWAPPVDTDLRPHRWTYVYISSTRPKKRRRPLNTNNLQSEIHACASSMCFLGPTGGYRACCVAIAFSLRRGAQQKKAVRCISFCCATTCVNDEYNIRSECFCQICVSAGMCRLSDNQIQTTHNNFFIC